MEDIKVGDYVRTVLGIGKVTSLEQDLINIDLGKKKMIDYNSMRFDIQKHSPNIVDIGKNYAYIYYGNCKTFTGYQIKSIVTKECFQSVSYEV